MIFTRFTDRSRRGVEAAFEEAIKYVRERQIRGHVVAEFQGIQWKLAEMYRDIEAGRSIAGVLPPHRGHRSP